MRNHLPCGIRTSLPCDDIFSLLITLTQFERKYARNVEVCDKKEKADARIARTPALPNSPHASSDRSGIAIFHVLPAFTNPPGPSAVAANRCVGLPSSIRTNGRSK